MANYTDEKMGHSSDNDGIEEYDNPLPDWWVGLFIITVIWAVGYWVDISFIRPESQTDWYEAELAAANIQWPMSEQVSSVSMTPEAIAAGEAIYNANCVACHKPDLTGQIGPNLIDDEWIHGGEPEQVMKTITEGVPDKGMITWGPILGPERIAQVTAYVLSKGEKN